MQAPGIPEPTVKQQEEFEAQIELMFRFASSLALLPLKQWKAAFESSAIGDSAQAACLDVITAAIPLQDVMLALAKVPRKGVHSESGLADVKQSVSS